MSPIWLLELALHACPDVIFGWVGRGWQRCIKNDIRMILGADRTCLIKTRPFVDNIHWLVGKVRGNMECVNYRTFCAAWWSSLRGAATWRVDGRKLRGILRWMNQCLRFQYTTVGNALMMFTLLGKSGSIMSHLARKALRVIFEILWIWNIFYANINPCRNW